MAQTGHPHHPADAGRHAHTHPVRKGYALSESTQFHQRARGAPGGCRPYGGGPASPKY
ncbi:hypothetical protein PAMP_010571 [Pampus punctatissimus]